MVQPLGRLAAVFLAAAAARVSGLLRLASPGGLCQEGRPVLVEVLVFSGIKNPVFELSGQPLGKFCDMLAATEDLTPTPSRRVVGFVGWRVCQSDVPESLACKGGCQLLRGAPALDQFLLTALVNAQPEGMPRSVLDHIQSELSRLAGGGDQGGDERDPVCMRDDIAGAVASANCTAPVLGPDDPHAVKFDPATDDRGCFVRDQATNNCYDYATDIVTNSFAQPGRGSGLCPPHTRPCVPDNCGKVTAAAVSDGLVWMGTTLPSSLPGTGHFVSLHIWPPETNFHWLRMDADGRWSHKPGGSQVRNVDNRGQIITDPGKADVSPWSIHCGYFLATPSNASIA